MPRALPDTTPKATIEAISVRVRDGSMEPWFPRGWLAVVLPEPFAPAPGDAVAVRLGDGRLALRFFVGYTRAGGAVLMRGGGPGGATRVTVAPDAAAVIGPVLDVRADVRTSGLGLVHPDELADAAREEPQIVASDSSSG